MPVYKPACVCVCACRCVPTVKLRPVAERGSANIQAPNTFHCTTAATAAAAAAASLCYTRD